MWSFGVRPLMALAWWVLAELVRWRVEVSFEPGVAEVAGWPPSWSASGSSVPREVMERVRGVGEATRRPAPRARPDGVRRALAASLVGASAGGRARAYANCRARESSLG